MSKFTAWIKSLSWIVVAGIIWAAVGMILNARRVGKLEAQVAHKESQVKDLRKDQAVDIRVAKKLQDEIAVKKIEALVVRRKSEASFERLGEDETIADIAERFNGKRVRSRKDPAS